MYFACLFRVTWQSHDNDVIGNHDKHNNIFKCIKSNSYSMSLITFKNGRWHGDILWKHVNIILPVDRILGVIRNIDFNLVDYACYVSSGKQKAAISYIILRRTHIRGLILIGPRKFRLPQCNTKLVFRLRAAS